ncbi:hypothetical protein L195_g059214, partial [Trifolium pratense]
RNLRKNGDDDDTRDDVVVWFPAMLMKSVMAMNGDVMAMNGDSYDGDGFCDDDDDDDFMLLFRVVVDE